MRPYGHSPTAHSIPNFPEASLTTLAPSNHRQAKYDIPEIMMANSVPLGIATDGF